MDFFKKKFAGAYDRDAYIKSKFEKSLKEFKLIEYLSSNISNQFLGIQWRLNKCADRFNAQQLRDLISRGTKSLVK